MKKSFFYFLIFIFLFFSLIVANNPLTIESLNTQIKKFCGEIYALLPPISMLLVVAAAATYAAGQLASAETRAKATGWATAMIVGALFAFILVSILPPIIKVLYGEGAICEGIVFD
ncbi:MAG: hypothetical protein N3D10_04170 [Candidatus Micrarchaeota archaeon]|nr:hypothetical protein [Candidatus Micrarchaeota archaeon]